MRELKKNHPVMRLLVAAVVVGGCALWVLVAHRTANPPRAIVEGPALGVNNASAATLGVNASAVVVAFYNVFNGGDGTALRAIVDEQLAALEPVMHRIARVHVVYFGDDHAAYRPPPSPKFALSNASGPTGGEVCEPFTRWLGCV